MIGTKDLNITGTSVSGDEVFIFKDGIAIVLELEYNKIKRCGVVKCLRI